MKQLLFICCFMFGSLMVWGQTKSHYEAMLDDDIKLAQRPQTNELLKSYLQPVADGTDTITALFLIPTACPRCESMIPPLVQLLKNASEKEKLLLVVCHEDAEAAMKYMDRQNLGGDIYLYDTENTFDKIFSTTMGGLQGLLIARIDVKHGRMITGGEVSYLSPAFFKDFLAVRTPLPYYVYDEDRHSYKEDKRINEQQKKPADSLAYDSHELLMGDYRPAQLRNKPAVRNGCLLFLDEMSNGAFQMSQSADGKYRLQHFLQVDSARRDTFVTLSPELYAERKASFRYMPLDVIFMPDNEVAMSYSLPRVYLENNNGINSVAFWNAPTFLHRSLQADEWPALVTFQNSDMTQFMEQNYRIFPLREGYAVMSCHKMVWPIMDEIKKGDPATDPFTDEFYSQDNPYALAVDLSTGTITSRFGQLEDIFKQTHTSYWFSDLVADTHGDNFIYGNSITGLLYLTNNKGPQKTLRTYRIFNLGDIPSAPDSLKYKEEYLQWYAPYFNHILEQVVLDDQFINCLIRTGILGNEDLKTDTYEYVRFSRETGKEVMRFTLQPENTTERVLSYGMTADNKGNRPFLISKENGKYYLKYIFKH